jgi:hypothetical protein
MKPCFFSLALACVISSYAKAQTPATTMPYGKIDKADLEMKSCDFENDANAMVLFKKGDVYYDQEFSIILEFHKRIKIFNDQGKDKANIRIEYEGGNRLEYLSDVQAETINLTDGKTEITKVDKKQMLTETVDKTTNALVFSFPNVKSGSVIEYKYRETINNFYDLPDWFFQEDIPVRYSEYQTSIPDLLYFKTQTKTYEPFVKNVHTEESASIGSGQNAFLYTNDKNLRAMANVHSLPSEPFMSSDVDNLQCIRFQLTGIRPTGSFHQSFLDTWAKVGGMLADDEDFGKQLKRKLANEEEIINKAKSIKVADEKIAYVFNEVKSRMKWNNIDSWETNDGVKTAWEKKTGNSAEVNLILYHLLKQGGVNAYPMVVSTRPHGKVNPAYPFVYQFNRAVVYVPVDSVTHYIIDATNKYNTFNETPANLLNSYGLYIDKENEKYDIEFLANTKPTFKSVALEAEITPDGKMNGDVIINNYSYNRASDLKEYDTDGEKKFIEYLKDKDNTLSIASLKMENMAVDSLPLVERANFKVDLTGSDGNYIYFKPNLFSSFRSNPFLSENRFSDIDFGFMNNLTITGSFKMPAGYKADALPKSVSMITPDKSITFRRIVAEQEGAILVRYTINYSKSIYFKEDYPSLHEFYKKLFEMMNEQIVLKKS